MHMATCSPIITRHSVLRLTDDCRALSFYWTLTYPWQQRWAQSNAEQAKEELHWQAEVHSTEWLHQIQTTEEEGTSTDAGNGDVVREKFKAFVYRALPSVAGLRLHAVFCESATGCEVQEGSQAHSGGQFQEGGVPGREDKGKELLSLCLPHYLSG